jgi:DNA-binding beta-propeller fold protein YncE
MALANVAALLAREGRRVLVVDWDLEAPGIEHYFDGLFRDRDFKVVGAKILRGATPGVVDLVYAYIGGQKLDWRDCILKAYPFGSGFPVSVITAGRDNPRDRLDYVSRVQALEWGRLFAEEPHLGSYIETLRDEWAAEFEFVLVDSRTGFTDIGGICTIHLPDALVLIFTSNRQSLDGVIKVVNRARNARQRLPVFRNHLVAIPVPGRDESLTEHDNAMRWRGIFAEELRDFYSDWLPKNTTPKQVLDVLRIPYKAYWSFGERLPVVEAGTTDPRDLGFAFDVLARLLLNALQWEKMSESQTKERSPREVGAEAEAAFSRLTPDIQESARGVFTRLVRPGRQGDRNAIRRVSRADLLSDLGPDSAQVVDALVNAGLLAVEPAKSLEDNASVQIADEGLLEGWERLRGWMDEDREFLLWRDQLQENLKKWADARSSSASKRRAWHHRIVDYYADKLLGRNWRTADALLRGDFLAEARRWLADRVADMSADEREYIQTSRARRTRQRLLQTAPIAVVLLGIVSVVVGILGVFTPNNPIPDRFVIVFPSNATLARGETVQLTAEVRDDKFKVVTGPLFAWESSDAGIAFVSSDGQIVGKGPGCAVITAISEGQKSNRANITVIPPPGTSDLLLLKFNDDVDPESFDIRGFTVAGAVPRLVLQRRAKEVILVVDRYHFPPLPKVEVRAVSTRKGVAARASCVIPDPTPASAFGLSPLPTRWGEKGSDDGQFFQPKDVAVDRAGNVYVADTLNHRVQVFDSKGKFLRKWGEKGSGHVQFDRPEGIAVDEAGNVYVADTLNHRVQVFNSTGQPLKKWGEKGSGDGDFQRPQGIAVDGAGNVFVADVDNRRIQVFDSKSQFLRKGDGSLLGSGGDKWIFPMETVVDAAGEVHVTTLDPKEKPVQVFAVTGQFLRKLGMQGKGDDQFIFPRGLAVDGAGNVYWADTENNRVLVFRTK